ncbi:MAG: class I SAM-dependent methyltransferase [Candidatus Sericytochromatia bacterium]
MKDNFSDKSDKYAKYRPTYPQEMLDFIFSLLDKKENAWDCGTGTGQIAIELSKEFNNVYATDISQTQLDNAIKKDNIFYSLQSAEQTNFSDNSFDLITVAQAIHWFDFDKFYSEVKRTLQENGVIAVIGYGLIQIDEKVDEIILDFYKNVVGFYWDKERKYIDEKYKTIPFPFNEIETPEFYIKSEWTFEHLLGYFETWSAIKHFIKTNQYNPVDNIFDKLKEAWGNDLSKKITFPVLLRIGNFNH